VRANVFHQRAFLACGGKSFIDVTDKLAGIPEATLSLTVLVSSLVNNT
jgi:hypothetical protein